MFFCAKLHLAFFPKPAIITYVRLREIREQSQGVLKNLKKKNKKVLDKWN